MHIAVGVVVAGHLVKEIVVEFAASSGKVVGPHHLLAHKCAGLVDGFLLRASLTEEDRYGRCQRVVLSVE